MVIQPTQNKPAGNDDFLRIQDLFVLCLAKWYWFVISLAILLGAATIYLLKTPPVYTRSASLLIKEDGNSSSANEAAGVLGDIDIFRTNTNINNEMLSIQSPAVISMSTIPPTAVSTIPSFMVATIPTKSASSTWAMPKALPSPFVPTKTDR